MKIGLLTTSIGIFGQKGFYNAQEIGLAKALDQYFEQVIVYKLILKEQTYSEELISGCMCTYLRLIPSWSFGANGIVDTSVLDEKMDILLCFADTQISVPKVYKWTKNNNVLFVPYIGVLKSHSTNKIKRIVMDSLFKKNLVVYQRSHCLVKTPTVEKKLKSMGVKNITLAPVGLDLSLLHQEYENVSKFDLKKKYGFEDSEKVIIFIGRLIDEKQPVRMIEIFNEIYRKDNNYRLLLVGTGPLETSVDKAINTAQIRTYVKRIDRISNSDIWELYCMAECFVNLNQQEIFGMAILEAMYYGCKVVAWKAPGPNLIIEDKVSGYLVDSNKMVIDAIMNASHNPENSRERIINNFTWDNMAKCICKLVEE